MSITPMPPAKAKGARFEHGSVLSGKTRAARVNSQWKSTNETFGRLFGFIPLYPRDFDQIQHFAHHRYTRIWEKDGEMARDRYALSSYLLWVLGPTYWYTPIRRILRFSIGVVTEPYIPEDRKADVIREARWHLAGYAVVAALSIATGSVIGVKFWLLPMLQLQNTIEHLGLPHVDAITENTRSTRTNAVMRWMCWNMQYHTAHHAFPGVPCYALSLLHQELFIERGRLPHTMSYLAFQWAVIRAFWNGRTEADYSDEANCIADDTDLQPVAPRVLPTQRASAMALRVYQFLWATEMRRLGAPERPVEERFDRVRDAGFDGMAIDLGAMDIDAARELVPEFARKLA